MVAVWAGTLAIGVSVGIVGVGGVFLIPALVAVGVPLETAIGTSLLTFVAAAIVATILYALHGRIDWKATLVTSAGSIVSGVLGAKVSVALPSTVVTACFALFLTVTGIAALARADARTACGSGRKLGPVALLVCGILAGFSSGLTGIGGNAVLVPLMLMLHAEPAAAIAISQPNAIFSSASGALGHVLFGHVDVRLAAMFAIFCCTGVIIGSVLHRRASAAMLRRIVGVAVLALASYLMIKLVLSGEGL